MLSHEQSARTSCNERAARAVLRYGVQGVLDFCSHTSFIRDIYLNTDCRVDRDNIFEKVCVRGLWVNVLGSFCVWGAWVNVLAGFCVWGVWVNVLVSFCVWGVWVNVLAGFCVWGEWGNVLAGFYALQYMACP